MGGRCATERAALHGKAIATLGALVGKVVERPDGSDIVAPNAEALLLLAAAPGAAELLINGRMDTAVEARVARNVTATAARMGVPAPDVRKLTDQARALLRPHTDALHAAAGRPAPTPAPLASGITFASGPETPAQRRRRTAVHEAGHAVMVAAVLHGARLDSVRIVAGGGATDYSEPLGFDPHDRVLFYWAGAAAEQLVLGVWRRRGVEGDAIHARAAAEAAGLPYDATEALRAALDALTPHVAAVRALAAVLEARGALTGAEAVEIIEAHRPNRAARRQAKRGGRP